MLFFHLPPVSIIFLCNREHSDFPHYIPHSHPKTLLKFTTMLDANASVDHRLTQAFPACVSTQHVRVRPIWNRAHPCGYQVCVFQGTTELLSSPSWCPQISVISQ